MRKFILLVFSFFIPIILWFALCTLRENYVWSNLFENREKVVILGDSHAEPLDISGSLNLANGGDPLLMPLLHLRRLTHKKSCSEISIVVLTVGPHNFSSQPEDKLNQKEGHEDWFKGNRQRIANALRIQEYFQDPLAPVHFNGVWKQEFSLLNKGLKKQPARRSDPPQLTNSNAVKRTERHRVQVDNWFVHGEHQHKFLDQIIQHCSKHELKLMLVGTPLHRGYRERIGESGWKNYSTYLMQCDSLHRHVQYLAYEEVDWPDSLFRDSDHLNSLGGRKLGGILHELILE
jgi:hypothetical protein